MTARDDDERFDEIVAAEDPDFIDIVDALELIMARLRRIEAKIDDLDSGEDIG
jgi:hypothetical protein